MNNSLSFFEFIQTVDNKVFVVDKTKKERFDLFYRLLVDWNSKINLISRNEKNILDRHFLNSACVAHFIKFNPQDKIADIGSGGGFPAIILKILFPDSNFVLIESIRKKCDFLSQAIVALDLKKIEVINDRAEKISSEKRLNKSFDYVTARAVSQLNDLIVLSRPFLKKEGKMVFLKGKNYTDEIASASLDHDRIQIGHLNTVSENQDGVLLVLSAT